MNSILSTPRCAGFGRAAYLGLICGAVGFWAGCASEPPSRVVSAPPPSPPGQQQTVVVPAATTTVAAQNVPPGTIVVTQAPPAQQQEQVLEQPSSRHIWIPGYWSWRDNRYVWIAGRWEVPPRSGAVWVAPRWLPESGAYRFYEGYWN